jgi:uncharacterized protein (DUF58 family)
VYFTRRYWAAAALAGLLATGGLVFEPLLLVGSGGLVAWLLAGQFLFARATARVREGLTVEGSVRRGTAIAGQPVDATLQATLPGPTRLAVAVHQSLPATATVLQGATRPGSADGLPIESVDSRDVGGPAVGAEFDGGETTATGGGTIRWAVAGRYALPPPTVVCSDRTGLFVDVTPIGEVTTTTVAPPRPTAAVSRGGDDAFTTDRPDLLGVRLQGDEPGETREYVPGDTLSLIDWKATARLGRLHVREQRGNARVTNAILIDARGRLALGPPGRTKLEHLRGVALALADRARRSGEAVGLTVVDDGGIAATVASGSTDLTYRRVLRTLYDLDPTPSARWSSSAERRTPAATAAVARRLESSNGDEPFSTRLSPFFADGVQSRSRREDPLFDATRAVVADARRGPADVTRIAILTDDTDRATLTDAVALARGTGAPVTVFVAGDVLFDPVGASVPADWHARRTSLEAFRSGLDRREGVRAFEVGPATSGGSDDIGRPAGRQRRGGGGSPRADAGVAGATVQASRGHDGDANLAVTSLEDSTPDANTGRDAGGAS